MHSSFQKTLVPISSTTMAIHQDNYGKDGEGLLVNASAKQPYISKGKRNINDSNQYTYSEMSTSCKNKIGSQSRTVMGNYHSS